MDRYPVNSDIAERIADSPAGRCEIYLTHRGLLVVTKGDEETVGPLEEHLRECGLTITDVLLVDGVVEIDAEDTHGIVPTTFTGHLERIAVNGDKAFARLGGVTVSLGVDPETMLARDGDLVAITWTRQHGDPVVGSFRNMILGD